MDASGALLSEARQIILDARTRAVRSVDAERVRMYWRLGQRIVEEEQGGEARAEYGKRIIDRLAEGLQPEFGGGLAARQLWRAKQFYTAYPILTAVRSELNWSQYRLLSSFVARQRRIVLEDDEFFVDLVLYNRLLREVGDVLSERG